VLSLTVRFMVVIGLVFVCFGSAYTDTLLFVLYRGRLQHTSAAFYLSLYCVYVALLAVNGISEGFVNSVSTRSQLKLVNVLLVAFSVSYMILATLLLRAYGTAGLIVANCLNMLIRIARSIHYIRSCFLELKSPIPLHQCLPHWSVLLAFAFSFLATQWSARYSTQNPLSIYHLLIGLGCFAAVAVVIVRSERMLLVHLKNIFAKKKQS